MKHGWEYKKLGEVCVVLDSRRKPVTKKDRKAGEYPYYGAMGIQDYVDDYIFDGDYLLVGEDGAKWGANDKTAFQIHGKCWVNNHAHILQINQDIVDTSFIEHYLVGKNLSSYITGAVVPKLTQASLVSIPIPIPPFPVQEQIVSLLDKLSLVIEKKKQQVKELDNLAQAIFYDMFGDPVENEKGWEVKKLKDVGSITTGSTPSTSNSDNYASNDICFVKPSDIEKEGITTIKSTEFYVSNYAYDTVCRKLPKGSVLTTCIGIIGKVGVLSIDATCNQQINAVIPNPSMSSTYLAYAILSIRDYIQNVANAPVVPIINKGQFSSFQIPSPPLPLQQSFAQKIESIERQKELIIQSIREAQTLFDSRMEYYFG